jgi:isopentenyl-diphosphate Delta-isomerase
MAEEQVILVDENDIAIGTMGKMEAHEKALLHRAFSVFIFNSNNELLLQRRALSKYHSGGLWTNTCCSHPKPEEKTEDAARRRLMEEMGMKAKLEHKLSFIYKTPFDNGLTEHEFDHVYFGITNDAPVINTDEVDSFRYITIPELKKEVSENPELFTSWFKIVLNKIF